MKLVVVAVAGLTSVAGSFSSDMVCWQAAGDSGKQVAARAITMRFILSFLHIFRQPEHKKNNVCRKTFDEANLTDCPENGTPRRSPAKSITLKFFDRTYNEHMRRERRDSVAWGAAMEQDIPNEIDPSHFINATRNSKSLMRDIEWQMVWP